jgi:hypothetical protein
MANITYVVIGYEQTQPFACPREHKTGVHYLAWLPALKSLSEFIIKWRLSPHSK